MKRSLSSIAVFSLGAWAGSLVLSCGSNERQCFPGDYAPCDCADGRPGYSQCAADGAGYGDCAYCGTVPGAHDAGGNGAGGEGGSGGAGGAIPLLPFMSECEEDAQCESGLCYQFNAKGPHCTVPCDSSKDCPLPSPGCNGMGVCKAP